MLSKSLWPRLGDLMAPSSLAEEVRVRLVLLTRWPSRPSKRHLKVGLQYMTSPEIVLLRPLPTLLQAGHRAEAQP